MTADPSGAPRSPNPRGTGARLREEIVRAARSILVTERTEAAVTLRGVARRVGITAPSIYAHFAGPREILDAVVLQSLDDLDAELVHAGAGGDDPVDRLLAVCRAWIAFGVAEPALYNLLFEDEWRAGVEWPARSALENERRMKTFGLLVAAVQSCIDDGSSDARSSHEAALEIWVAMHGLIVLRGARDRPPWPPREAMDRSMVFALARIRRGARAEGGPDSP